MGRPSCGPARARGEAREGRRRDRLRQLERRHSGQALGASRRARRRASAPHRGRAPERVRDGDRRAHEIAAARGRGARRRWTSARHHSHALNRSARTLAALVLAKGVKPRLVVGVSIAAAAVVLSTPAGAAPPNVSLEPNPNAFYSDPAWSPDGKTIAFKSNYTDLSQFAGI